MEKQKLNIKKNKRNKISNITKEKFMNTCPVTKGICLNPLCIFGCLER
jgi:ribosomal protein S12